MNVINLIKKKECIDAIIILLVSSLSKVLIDLTANLFLFQ